MPKTEDVLNTFQSINDARTFLEVAMQHYQEQVMPSWFTEWLEELYNGLGKDWGSVTLDELATLSSFFIENVWASRTLAMNQVYQLSIRQRDKRAKKGDHTYYSCAKDDGFIYMLRRGAVVRRPKRLYGEQIERELASMKIVCGYIRISQGDFEELAQGLPVRIDE